MQISVGQDNVNFSPVEVGINQLRRVVTESNYSFGVYRNNYRKRENFVSAEAIGLDVDDGISITEMKERLDGYQYILAPTRNHKKEKGGKVADRFRAILFLESPITDIDDYYTTWQSLYEQFPFIDPKCKDPSRFYYPSPTVEKVRVKGKRISPIKAQLKTTVVEEIAPDGVRGTLAVSSYEFLFLGKHKGSRHDALYAAARDAHEQGYTRAEVSSFLTKNPLHDIFTKGERRDEAERAIKDAYSKPVGNPLRATEKAFNFVTIKELISTKYELKWLVDDLLTEGGISVLAGDPKAGKSTLSRQLARAVCRGEKFLNRSVKKGPVLYLALEEQEAMLNHDFKMLGVNDEDPILLHVGGVMGPSPIQELRGAVEEHKPSLIVADTMFLLLACKSITDYKEVNDAISPYRKLARDSGSHLMFIHHTNKSGIGTNSISGSKAIHGAVDCALVFELINNERFITTSQRGGKPFYEQHLVFDPERLVYMLGDMAKKETKDEF